MKSLQETLTYLINHRLFASSPTAFGQLFAEKDRNRGIRIIKGITQNFDSTLQKFEETFALKEKDLFLWVEIDKLASVFHKSIQNEEWKGKEYKILKAIIEAKFRKIPSEFKEYIPLLNDLKHQYREYYIKFIALAFLNIGEYRIYHKHFEEEYLLIWQDLKRFFHDYFPNRIDLQKIVEAYISSGLYQQICHKSIWGIIEHLSPTLDVAENPEKLEERLRAFHLFDWEDNSYWIEADAKFSMGKSAFYWVYQIDTQVSGRGIYHLSHIHCGKTKEDFQLGAIYSLSFTEINDYEGYEYFVQFTEIANPENIILGLANFDEEKSLLNFEFEVETTFPTSLKMIDRTNPKGREEKVWKGIIDVYEEKAAEAIELQYINKVENIELLDDKYEVVDVMVNRHEMIISVLDLQSEEKTITDHRIDLGYHDFLKTILPLDEITIVRQNADDKLYFWWVDKNLRLCLDEFE